MKVVSECDLFRYEETLFFLVKMIIRLSRILSFLVLFKKGGNRTDTRDFVQRKGSRKKEKGKLIGQMYRSKKEKSKESQSNPFVSKDVLTLSFNAMLVGIVIVICFLSLSSKK